MSLYNDIRPTTLDEVIGQDNIKGQLKGVLASGNIPNAFLLTGPRGTGKTTIARIIARTLNCESENAPCGECQSCKDILSGTSMDVIEMDAASNNKVEDVRGIIEKAQYAPMSKYKVFILDEVHMFSQGAWNALLKLIEEPPVGVVFILCTTEEHKVPATIISRCRKFYFEKIDLTTVTQYLAQVCEGYGKAYEEDALKLIAQASEGCMRDALSIMESFFDTDSLCVDVVANTLGVSDEDAVFGILNAISNGDASGAVTYVREQSKRGKNAQLLIKALIGAITDTMFVLSGADAANVVNTSKYKELLMAYATKTDSTRCLELSKTLGEVYGTLSKVPDALFLIESALIRSIRVESLNSIPVSKIAELERRIAALEKGGVPAVTEHVQLEEQPSVIEDVAPDNMSICDVPDYDTNVVDFPNMTDDRSADELISSVGINAEIAVEDEIPSMDISSDLPFEEDEFVIPTDMDNIPASFQNEVPAEIAPAPQEKPVVSMADDYKEDMYDDIPDDLLAHLPKGTVVASKTISVKPSAEPIKEDRSEVSQIDTVVANDNTVGEAEPMIKSDDSFVPVGFSGFADWL